MGQAVDSVAGKIKDAITSGEEGRIYFVADFIEYGNDDLVRKVMFRLEKKSILIRLAKGIYLYPVITRFGILYPPLHIVAKAIAERDRAIIMPTGSTALNQLGLSTQVPMNVVYLTTGSARTIQIGKRKITFKHSTPKNFSYKGSVLPLIVLALKDIGEKNVDTDILRQINDLLSNIPDSEKDTLNHDLALASGWIRSLLLPIIKKQNV